MNLQQLRNEIRVQLDMDEEELPNPMLDSYLSEAYNRTISMEPRWPFFESRWSLPTTTAVIPLPVDVDTAMIISLVDTDTRTRLMQVSNEVVEDNFRSPATVTQPVYYTIWSNEITLWPAYAGDERIFSLRGFRLPVDWIAGGASAEPDADSRLHKLLVHYAIALAYAQQEDEVLEDQYMKRWQSSFVAARDAICAPRHHRPLIFNGGLPYIPGYQPAMWNLPV